MTYDAVEINLTITLQSAMHIGTGFGLAQLIDDRVVQGPHPDAPNLEAPYIPGSSLKGRLRHHVRELGAALDWPNKDRLAVEERLFGFGHAPGRLIFSDAHLDPAFANQLPQKAATRSPGSIDERTFVSLSRTRHVALEQRLFRIEAAEGGMPFITRVRGALPSADALADLATLTAAVRMVTHLGGHKGRGLGDCRIAIDAVTHQAAPLDPDALLERLPL